jgi:Domain of unknown function (DUF4330)
MSIVDDRGRIAGRINLIDAAIVIVIVALIPAAYGSYLLFRSPRPTLLGITPNRLYQGNNLKVAIDGRDLRPFLRVSFNDVQGRTFLISSTTSAFVDLPDLAAGSYDIVLYDYSQELARLPKALTILPLSPTPVLDMEVSGVFFGQPEAMLSELKPGVKFPPTGDPHAEILTVGTPMPASIRVHAGAATLAVPTLESKELPATLRVRCSLKSAPNGLVCEVAGPQQPAPVAPDSVLVLSGPNRSVTFQIHDVHLTSAPPVSQAHVRFIVSPELLSRLKAGDSDNSANAAGRFRQATIAALGASHAITAAEAGPGAPLGGVLRIVDVTVRVPVDRVRNEWVYKDQPFKIGAPFTFETPEYVVHGEVVDMTPPVESRSAPPVR